VISLPEGEPLDNSIKRCESEMHEQNESEGFKGFIPKWREVFRYAMNAVLYATMPDADVEHLITDPEARALFARVKKAPKGSKKRGKLNDRLRDMNTRKHWLLGRTIKVDRTILETAKGTDAGRKLRVRFRRTGHFRWQPYGPGRELHKRIWIRPTMVGGKDLPLVTAKHRLEKHDE